MCRATEASFVFLSLPIIPLEKNNLKKLALKRGFSGNRKKMHAVSLCSHTFILPWLGRGDVSDSTTWLVLRLKLATERIMFYMRRCGGMAFVCLQLPCLAGGHSDYSCHVLPKCLSDSPKLLLCSQRCCRSLNPEPSSQREMASDLSMVGAIKKWQNNQSANKWPLQTQQRRFAFLPATHPPITLETELKPWVMKKSNTIGPGEPTNGKAMSLLFVLPCPSQETWDSSPFSFIFVGIFDLEGNDMFLCVYEISENQY